MLASLAAARAPSSRAARAPARLARGGAAAPSSACVVAVDVGTESLRAAVVDGDGQVLASASAPHATTYPAPGHAEQAPAFVQCGFGRFRRAALRPQRCSWRGSSAGQSRAVPHGPMSCCAAHRSSVEPPVLGT